MKLFGWMEARKKQTGFQTKYWLSPYPAVSIRDSQESLTFFVTHGRYLQHSGQLRAPALFLQLRLRIRLRGCSLRNNKGTMKSIKTKLYNKSIHPKSLIGGSYRGDGILPATKCYHWFQYAELSAACQLNNKLFIYYPKLSQLVRRCATWDYEVLQDNIFY